MSSTRTSASGEFHQERFCSSPEFQVGTINGLAAAKRIAIEKDRAVREVLWWLQWRSISPGGLQAVCDELSTNFCDRITTPTLRTVMDRKNKRPSPVELKAIGDEVQYYRPADLSKLLSAMSGSVEVEWTEVKLSPEEQALAKLDDTRQAAAEDLLKHLTKCCLDPSQNLSASPWYFCDLIGTLRLLRQHSIDSAKSRLADTAISRLVNAALDFCFARRRMVLIEGVAGIGRSETAKAWRDAHAGLARYIEVPSSSDDRSFYSSIALQLGVARGTSYKAQEIKVRVEMLAGSDLVLLLDEAHYLWPQYLRPRKTPDRLLWVKSIFDAGTPIALIAHTDFSRWQAHCVKQTLWSDEQFERRLNRKISLPRQHPRDDLMKIAEVKFPEGDQRSWKLLSAYALGSEKKQASGITEALESACYRAQRAGRKQPIFEDIEAALIEDHGFISRQNSEFKLPNLSSDRANPVSLRSNPSAKQLRRVASTSVNESRLPVRT